MPARKGFVGFRDGDLRVSLNPGDVVPCPNCSHKHIAQRDPRPGTRLNTETGVLDQVPNEALFIECPETPGPILVGMEGRALPQPLELTPRKHRRP